MSIKFKPQKIEMVKGILNITDNAEWVSTSNGAWCYYNNDNNYV